VDTFPHQTIYVVRIFSQPNLVCEEGNVNALLWNKDVSDKASLSWTFTPSLLIFCPPCYYQEKSHWRNWNHQQFFLASVQERTDVMLPWANLSFFFSEMWRCISVERNNKQTCVKLFAENTSSLKNGSSAPIASFIAKLIVSLPPNQQTIVHPGKLLLLINLFDKKNCLLRKTTVFL
jgi:hypothetical protein